MKTYSADHMLELVRVVQKRSGEMQQVKSTIAEIRLRGNQRLFPLRWARILEVHFILSFRAQIATEELARLIVSRAQRVESEDPCTMKINSATQ